MWFYWKLQGFFHVDCKRIFLIYTPAFTPYPRSLRMGHNRGSYPKLADTIWGCERL